VLRGTLKPNLLSIVRDGQLIAVTRSIELNTGLTYRKTREGDSIRGACRPLLDLASNRISMLDDGIGFNLVPWWSLMEEYLAQELRGVAVGSASSWDFSRAHGLGR